MNQDLEYVYQLGVCMEYNVRTTEFLELLALTTTFDIFSFQHLSLPMRTFLREEIGSSYIVQWRFLGIMY